MNNKRFTIYALCFIAGIFATLSVVGIFLARSKVDTEKAATSIIKKQEVVKTPSQSKLYIKSSIGRTVYSADESIKLVVYADSAGIPIEGYDIVIQSGLANKMDVVAVKSLLPDFEVTDSTRKDTISFTGIKKENSKESSVFFETALVEVTFKSATPGRLPLNFEYSKGATNDSNLIDNKAKDVLDSVSGIILYSGEKKQLSLGSSVEITEGVTMSLIEAVIAPSDCNDCGNTARIEVVQGREKKQLLFESGGFVGKIDTVGEAFGYQFEVASFGKDGIALYVAKSGN